MTQKPTEGRSENVGRMPSVLPGGLLFFAVFTLYLATLAPTVLWGDDAELQRMAILNQPGEGVRAYHLWTLLAHQFNKLPFGDPAWRINLSSAFFAAGSTAVLYATLRLWRRPPLSAVAGSIALAVSHTFWLHAVRTEVYALFMLINGLALLFLSLWSKEKPRPVWLGLGLFFLSLGFAAHRLTFTLLPAFGGLLLLQRQKLNRQNMLVGGVAFAAGLLPFLLWSGLDGGGFRPGGLSLRDFALWIGFTGYQFLFFLPLAAFGVWELRGEARPFHLFTLLTFAANILFVFTFDVPDQYVFYLPSYWMIAIWISGGAEALQKRLSLPTWRALALILLCVGGNWAVYRLTPVVLNRLEVNLLAVRALPYRDNNRFFLYPPKNGYDGAHRYGTEVLAALPAEAGLLADWLPYQTVRYFQDVEGVRRDVLLFNGSRKADQLPWLLEQGGERPLYLADDGRYYDTAAISTHFQIRPDGLVYTLTPLTKAD